MSATRATIALGVLLMAGAPLAEAQRSGGGSHGNGSHGGSSGGGSHGQSGGGSRPVSGAEARHPQGGSGHGYYSPHYYYGHGYYPYYGYYGGYYPYYYGGYYPYYGYGYGYGPYFGLGFTYNSGGYYGGDANGDGYADGPYYHSTYPPYRYRYRETGSIRTLVEPENTKVYVDGYYAGQVDDFDGMFQRLYAGAGRHDIIFKLEGYRTHRVKVYVTEDQTIKIRHTMEKGNGEETVTDMTEGREEPPYRVDRERENDDERWVPRDAPRDSGPHPRQQMESREAGPRDGGAIRLDVRPDDATVYVDGEFYGPARRGATLNLPAGRHHIEVVRPGFRTLERDVEIRPGRTESVSFELERS